MIARISPVPANCSPRPARRGFCRLPRPYGLRLLAVHCLGIKHLLGVNGLERHCAPFAERHSPIEARAAAGVAGTRPYLLHPYPDSVLIAVDAHLAHALHVSGGLALAPERAARATEIPGFPGRNSSLQGLRVHVRDHQYLARTSIGRNAGDEPIGIEFWAQCATLFDVL